MASIAEQVVAAQAALVEAVEAQVPVGVPVLFGEPIVPPSAVVWVAATYNADLEGLDSSARSDRASVRLVVCAHVAGVADEAGSAAPLIESLTALVTAVERAVRNDPTLAATVPLARVTRLSVSEQVEEARLVLLAVLDLAATVYGQ